jgi:hypothetical protein
LGDRLALDSRIEEIGEGMKKGEFSGLNRLLNADSFGASVVNLTLLYLSSEAVISAMAGIQSRNTGFRVKPGMTNK